MQATTKKISLGVLSCIAAAASLDAYAAVGRSAGAFDVSATGAAMYQVPLWVSPGAGGVQPALAMAYNSRGGDGVAGPGWNLAGLSSIARCAKTFAQDSNSSVVSLTTADAFCLDGQRLRLTSGAAYGDAGSTYQTEIANFALVTAVSTAGNGPASFVVKTKDGWTYEYGNTTDSRITPSSSEATPYLWLVNKVSDRDGNSYVVTYSAGASGSVGVGVPSSISYSPSTAGGSSYVNSVSFEYATKVSEVPATTSPSVTGFIAGSQVVNTSLLKAVNMYSGGNLVRRYALGYEAAPTTTRARLRSVTECVSGGDCLQPTLIGYQNGASGFTTVNPTSLAFEELPTMDLTGDGREDLLTKGMNATSVRAGTSSGGFSSAIPVFSTSTWPVVAVGEFVGKGHADLLVAQGSAWWVYSWNGTAFVGAPTSATVAANTYRGEMLDVDGDGRKDLVTFSASGNNNLTSHAIYVYRNIHTENGSTFLNGTLAYSTNWQCGTGELFCANYFTTESAVLGSRRSLDFNGDGRADLVFSGQATQEDDSGGYQAMTVRYLRSNGSGFVVAGGDELSLGEIPQYVWGDWNDDACTDAIIATTVVLAACNGALSGSVVELGVTPSGMIDWNQDGRGDALYSDGTNLNAMLSTGTGASGPVSSNVPAVPGMYYTAFDPDGDGLQDLVVYGSSATIYRNNGAGTPADLVTSITDGFGVSASPTYVSLVNSGYEKGTAATYPEQDFVRPIYIVSSVSTTSGASDGGSATSSRSYQYFEGRTNLIGRGFGGFGRVRVTDGRNGIIRDTYRRTAFPYAGFTYQEDLFQPDGATLISHVTAAEAVTDLDTTADNQRYFPYVGSTDSLTYEVGGTSNGLPVKRVQQSFTFDTSGNATNVATTTTDSFTGSPQHGQQWTSTIVNTISPDTSNWCLYQPTQTTVTNSAPGAPTLTRTTGYVVDYAKCRVTQETIEPGNSELQVATGFGYDGFGNIDSVTVTPAAGQGQVARSSGVYWGSTGRFPETVTNALSQSSTMAWDQALGLRSSVTDANNVSVSFQYDEFGRLRRENRADGTATSYDFYSCDIPTCGTADLRYYMTINLRDPSNNVVRADSRYFDMFGRARIERSQLLGSSNRETSRVYDVFGRVANASVPHAVGATAYNTAFYYDLLGRITLERRPTSAADASDRDITYSYQGPTTVQTDALNRNTSQRRNALGLIAQVFDAAGSDTDYEYDAFGNLLKTRDVLGNEVVLTYNIRGMKMSSNDPDLGSWSYTYFPMGEVESQTDAKFQTTTYTYDVLSRPLTRTESEGVTTWTWGVSSSGHNIGQLQSVSSPGYSEAYTYDSLGRLSNRQLVGDATYDFDYTYDPSTGKLGTLTYPTSTSSYRLKLQYVYQNALLQQIGDANSSTVFWQAGSVNSFGRVTQETLGNGVVTNRVADDVTGSIASIQSGVGGGAALQNESYLYDKMGNVTQRQNNTFGLTENFYYDSLNRLDYSQLGTTTTLDLSYDAIGNITSRTDVAGGATWTYHATKKHAVVQAGNSSFTYSYDDNGNATTRNGQSITWTSYNYPSAINGPGKSMSFTYGPDRQRLRQIYLSGAATETTIYVGGLLEKVTTASGTDWRHYVSAEGRTMAIVSRKSNGTNTTRYFLEDHQQSVSRILNSDGSSYVAESFAAFGQRRDPQTWSGPCPCPDLQLIKTVSRRGYTGHEMIGGQSMGLIHMNGRVQDSITGRFLSPDPYVQAPLNMQSLNRFSYALNNPLRFNDPSGFNATDDCVQAPINWHGEVLEGPTVCADRPFDDWDIFDDEWYEGGGEGEDGEAPQLSDEAAAGRNALPSTLDQDPCADTGTFDDFLDKNGFQIADRTFDIVGGIGQIGLGIGICAGVVSCVGGAVLIVQGLSNVYEGAFGEPSVLRSGYQAALGSRGGDLAYSIVDIGSSAGGLARSVVRPDTFKLFRNISTDYVPAFNLATGTELAQESIGLATDLVNAGEAMGFGTAKCKAP